MEEDNRKYLELEKEMEFIHAENAPQGEEDNLKYLELEREMELFHSEKATEGDNDSEEGKLEVKRDSLDLSIIESSQESEPAQEASQTTLSPMRTSLLNIPADVPIVINRILQSEITQPAMSPTIVSMPESPFMFSQELPLTTVGTVPSPVSYAEPDTSVPFPQDDSSIDTDVPDFSQESTPKVSEVIYDDMTIEVTKLSKPGRAVLDNSTTKKKGEKEIDILAVRAVGLEENEVMASTSSEIASPSPAETVLLDDNREYRTWKKSVMLVYNRLISHRHASLFLKPITDKQAPGYHRIIHRPMDLPTIRKNIKNGVIRTTKEFHRDVLLMFLNALMYNKRNGTVYNMALEMLTASLQEIQVLEDAEQAAAARREAQALELGLKRKVHDEFLTKKRRDE